VIATGAETESGVIFSMMQDVCPALVIYAAVAYDLSTDGRTAKERRTPLQLMEHGELAKELSFFSFGVISVICLIGVFQSRSWLEMCTISGTYQRKSLHWVYTHECVSLARGCC